MRFEPLEDRILIQADEAESQKGSIIIPETFRRQPQTATVIAVSGGIRNAQGELVEPLVKPGDRILFAKYTGTEVTIDETPYVIMREGDILGILHEKEIQ